MDQISILSSGAYMTVNKVVAVKLGTEAAAFLCEIISYRDYLYGKDKLQKDQSFFWTIEACHKETGLTRKKQERVIRDLTELNLLISFTGSWTNPKTGRTETPRFFKLNAAEINKYLITDPENERERKAKIKHRKEQAKARKAKAAEKKAAEKKEAAEKKKAAATRANTENNSERPNGAYQENEQNSERPNGAYLERPNGASLERPNGAPSNNKDLSKNKNPINNKSSKDLNLDQYIDLQVLDIPMSLKQQLKDSVKVNDSFNFYEVEDFYNSSHMIKPDCTIEDTEHVNKSEFTKIVKAAFKVPRPIRNTSGLLYKFVLEYLNIKESNLHGTQYEAPAEQDGSYNLSNYLNS